MQDHNLLPPPIPARLKKLTHIFSHFHCILFLASIPFQSAEVQLQQNKKLCNCIIGHYHPLDGVNNPKYKLLCFLKAKIVCIEKSLALNQDRCCHLALCLWLILFCSLLKFEEFLLWHLRRGDFAYSLSVLFTFQAMFFHLELIKRGGVYLFNVYGKNETVKLGNNSQVEWSKGLYYKTFHGSNF